MNLIEWDQFAQLLNAVKKMQLELFHLTVAYKFPKDVIGKRFEKMIVSMSALKIDMDDIFNEQHPDYAGENIKGIFYDED